jgi:putative endonuclease
MHKHLELGSQGELAVSKHLQREGFKILAQNFRLRCGEIDLIAQRDEVICFVEIKTRTTEHFATSQVVTKSKQLKIIKTAQYYALKNRITNKVLRFDVAIVTGTTGSFDIRYLPNAFTNSSRSLY